MKFNELTLTVNTVSTVFQPFDRGASGSFVYRLAGKNLNAPRLIASLATNDSASDKATVQVNTPRVIVPAASSNDPAVVLGTDIAKAEFRFLATTSSADRTHDVDQLIEALKALKLSIANREKIYA